MNKTVEITVKLTMDEEKMQTLLCYLPQEDKTLDAILQESAARTLEKLYGKNVPLAVQNFLSLKNGAAPIKKLDRPKMPRKPKDKKEKPAGGQALEPTAPNPMTELPIG